MAPGIISEVYEKYVDFVKRNVEIVSEIETALKWMSYFISGKGTSAVLSELVYSTSSVLTLVNDTVIRQCFKRMPENIQVRSDYCIRLVLTLVEYLEVFAEISSDLLWGLHGKWIVVTLIQLCKAALRLVLMLKPDRGIVCSPSVPPLTVAQRKRAVEQLQENENHSVPMEEDCSASAGGDSISGKSKAGASDMQMTVTLKRSGRVMRTISSAPTVTGRSWKPPTPLPENNVCSVIDTEASTTLNEVQIFAEILHVLRPVIQLLTMLSAGRQSWAPWIISCGMDIASLQLLGSKTLFNVREKGELRYRTIALLYYLLRSPFYHKYTRRRLAFVLEGLSNNVPLAKLICKPLVDYIPVWQKIYFYSWGS